MFINFGGKVINKDRIKFVRDLSENEGASRVQIVYDDKENEIISGLLSEFERFCGTIIPAPAGYRVIKGWKGGDKDGGTLFDEYDVLAFRYNGEENFQITPITVEGEPSDDYAIVEPNGTCRDVNGVYDSADEYKTWLRSQHEKYK